MTYSSVITADSPYVWYRTGETSGTSAANSGSMAGSGTYNGSPTLATSPAAQIDGTSFYAGASGQYISQVLTALPTANFTAEFWYKRNTGFTQAPSTHMIMSNGNGTFWQMQLGSSTNGIFVGSGGSMGTTLTNAALFDGNWHHVAFSYGGATGGTNVLYIDGVSIGTVNGTLGSTGTTTLYVGSYNSAAQCNIDEPAVYYSALSQGQIAAHVNAGSPSYKMTVLTDSPKHYLTYDETTLADSGANKASLTVTGGTTQATTGVVAGKAETFNGTTQTIAINSSYDFSAGSAWTYETWFKTTANTGTPELIRKDGGGRAYLLRLNAG
jgi:hypothetical protein